MSNPQVRINPRTGKPIILKMQQSDAIQKAIYERPGSTLNEIYARVTQLFPHLDITKERVEEHVNWASDPKERKSPWLKPVTDGRVWPALEIRPEWQL